MVDLGRGFLKLHNIGKRVLSNQCDLRRSFVKETFLWGIIWTLPYEHYNIYNNKKLTRKHRYCKYLTKKWKFWGLSFGSLSLNFQTFFFTPGDIFFGNCNCYDFEGYYITSILSYLNYWVNNGEIGLKNRRRLRCKRKVLKTKKETYKLFFNIWF